MIVNVKITTFKESGKYYDSWVQQVDVEKDEWYHIINSVRLLKPTHSVQTEMDWLIGMDIDGRDDNYPIILKA